MFSDTVPCAGKRWTIYLPKSGIELTFRFCPPGEFLMGCPDKERILLRQDPVLHYVRLSKGFWLLETPITNDIWNVVMKDVKETFWRRCWKKLLYFFPMNEHSKKGNDKKNQERWEKCPVQVDWYDALVFLDILNSESIITEHSYFFTIPTQSQWEYACRAGTLGVYSGTGKLDEMGWFDENSCGHIHEVGLKQPNNWGFYDMHGNVHEWCCCGIAGCVFPPKAAVDPGNNDVDHRVFCGGGYWSHYEDCRSYSQKHASLLSDDGGLRLALVHANSAPLTRKCLRQPSSESKEKSVPLIQEDLTREAELRQQLICWEEQSSCIPETKARRANERHSYRAWFIFCILLIVSFFISLKVAGIVTIRCAVFLQYAAIRPDWRTITVAPNEYSHGGYRGEGYVFSTGETFNLRESNRHTLLFFFLVFSLNIVPLLTLQRLFKRIDK